MKYKLRKRLFEDTAYYEKDIVDKYVDYLIEQERVITLDNLLFDADALLEPFVCNTQLCIPEKRTPDGKMVPCKKKQSFCCSHYAPRMSTDERERVDTILPAVRKRFPHLDRALSKVDSYYEWDENYDRMIIKDKRDFCIFTTPDNKEFGIYACMLHAYCLENNLSPEHYKPSACIMFPIYIFEMSDGERTLVTSHTKEARNVGETEEIFSDLPCMKPNKLARQPLYMEMKSTLVYMYGEKLWNRLDEALGKWQQGKKP